MGNLTKKQFVQILEKYNSGNASQEDIDFLDAYYNVYDLKSNYTAGLADKDLIKLKTELKNSISEDIQFLDAKNATVNKRIVFRLIASAAAALIIIIAGLKYYPLDANQAQVINKFKVEEDIAPGGNKAVLTLADGRKIDLTDGSNGLLAEQSGIKITKTADGQLVYRVLDSSQEDVVPKNQFNTIETPNGGQYQVLLQDGSIVWLNAASKLTFPTNFASQTSRSVDLIGEAYFEIAKDPSKPFVVNTETQKVEVFGTHFNINSYVDEPEVKTTLLEGSIRVKLQNGGGKILKPGQQSSVDGSSLKVETVDTELVVAWKNQQFTFESDDIRYIMRMVERWYNVKVEYEGPIPENKFGGAVSRFENVSEVLKSLESTGRVKFKIDGKRIIVSK